MCTRLSVTKDIRLRVGQARLTVYQRSQDQPGPHPLPSALCIPHNTHLLNRNSLIACTVGNLTQQPATTCAAHPKHISQVNPCSWWGCALSACAAPSCHARRQPTTACSQQPSPCRLRCASPRQQPTTAQAALGHPTERSSTKQGEGEATGGGDSIVACTHTRIKQRV